MLRAAVDKVEGLDAADIDDVIIGNATPEAEQGLNLARNSAIWPAYPTRFRLRRSTASAPLASNVAHGAEKILAGWADVVLTGGVEHESPADGRAHPMPNPELMQSRPDVYAPMGLTAEVVAERYGISRAEQDAFALTSHRGACCARNREV